MASADVERELQRELRPRQPPARALGGSLAGGDERDAWEYGALLQAGKGGAGEKEALRSTIAELQAELASVVAWRSQQAAGGQRTAEGARALASLVAQNSELRRLQYESERERSALRSRVVMLEEELRRTSEYMLSSVPRYQREIGGLRARLEQLAAAAAATSSGQASTPPATSDAQRWPRPTPSPTAGAREPTPPLAAAAARGGSGLANLAPSLPTVQRRVQQVTAAPAGSARASPRPAAALGGIP